MGGLRMATQGPGRWVRCGMPESYPEVAFDSDGLCNFCRHYDATWAEWMSSPELQRQSEAELKRIFAAP